VIRAWLFVPLAAIACGAATTTTPSPTGYWWEEAAPVTTTESPVAAAPVAGAAYRDAADRITSAALADPGAWQKLSYLTDRIGHRLSGSPALDRAIAWAVETMTGDGHDVRTEKVMVPHWERGFEAARVIAPIERDLVILGLGNTIATPKGGITAPVVVVGSWQELEAKKDAVKGAIVLYDVAMTPWTEEGGSGYDRVAEYRRLGPGRAAALGAAAVLLRSVTAHSLRTPHTGATHRDGPTVPAAAVTVEDAALLARLAAAGPVKVTLVLSGRMLPDAPSANVIAELRGRERPDEVALIACHLDSWDVGQGAHDDGAGCAIVMQALTVLRRLGLAPRRTIRVVLYTNEENGLRGGAAYAKEHAAEIPRHVMALEADSGGFAPWGFEASAGGDAARADRIRARLAALAPLVARVGATRIKTGGAGADVTALAEAGVPGVGFATAPQRYFDYHHTHADTLDKVDPRDLAACVAAVAVLAYVVADQPGRLDDP